MFTLFIYSKQTFPYINFDSLIQYSPFLHCLFISSQEWLDTILQLSDEDSRRETANKRSRQRSQKKNTSIKGKGAENGGKKNLVKVVTTDQKVGGRSERETYSERGGREKVCEGE